MAADLTADTTMMSRAEVAEEIVRLIAPFAEAGGHDEFGAYVSMVLSERFLLDDYARIKAGEQDIAFTEDVRFDDPHANDITDLRLTKAETGLVQIMAYHDERTIEKKIERLRAKFGEAAEVTGFIARIKAAQDLQWRARRALNR